MGVAAGLPKSAWGALARELLLPHRQPELAHTVLTAKIFKRRHPPLPHCPVPVAGLAPSPAVCLLPACTQTNRDGV